MTDQHYTGWRDVPGNLMTANRLRELEFPRKPGPVVATVDTRNWRGKSETFDLYDVFAAEPTSTAAARLEELAATKGLKIRTCEDCGAHCQHLLDPASPLCPACRHIALIRAVQNNYAAYRPAIARDVGNWLATPGAAVVQVHPHRPPRTDSGRERPPTALRVHAVDVTTEEKIIDVLVRTAGPRAKFVPDRAVDRDTAAPRIHQALLNRLLLFWDKSEGLWLRETAPHDDWTWPKVQPWKYVRDMSTRWRGEIDLRHPVTATSHTLTCNIPPGTPDRLLLHLRRIARTAPQEDPTP